MLKQSHTKTSSRSLHCKRTAPKLLYMAKGLKYGWYHHDDVMQISTLNFAKTLLEGRSFIIAKLSLRGCCTKAVEHFLFCAQVRNW